MVYLLDDWVFMWEIGGFCYYGFIMGLVFEFESVFVLVFVDWCWGYDGSWGGEGEGCVVDEG